MTITDVKVNGLNTSDERCLNFTCRGVTYHVWLNERNEVKKGVGTFYPALYKHAGAEVRILNGSLAKNREMIEQAIAEAVALHAFEACERELSEQRRRRLANRAAEQILENMQTASPEMFAVLVSIAEFWKINKGQPLSPGAMISPEGDELIGDAVERVLLLARTGGRVDLIDKETV